MFDQFPKNRSELPERYQKIYARHYKRNRQGKGPFSFFSQKVEGWMHRRVAADLGGGAAPEGTLEIGAGTLNQLNYETASAPYDIVEPFAELYRDSPFLSRVRRIYKDIVEVDAAARYGRITAVAAFEHLLDLPAVVAHCCLHLNPCGCLRAAIPNEGHWPWRMSYMLTTGLEFRLRYRLKYSLLVQHEHVNSADEVEEVLNHFFSAVRCRVLGVSRILSLFRFYECRQPRLDAATGYLRGLSGQKDLS